jgi:hydrogenase maturation protein HypF
MQLEQMAEPGAPAGYPFRLLELPEPDGGVLLDVDWRPAVAGVLSDLRRGTSPSSVAGRFHLTLAQMIGAVAEWFGLDRVVLSGGCFQNAVLTTLAVRDLRARRFQVITASRIPPNDGGLSVGQALVAAHHLLERGR